MTTRRAPLREVNSLAANQGFTVGKPSAKTKQAALSDVPPVNQQRETTRCRELTVPPAKTLSTRAPPAAAASPTSILERTAIASLLGFSLNSTEDPLTALCRMHAMCLRASRQTDFCEFKQKLRAEIVAGNLCLAEGKDLLLVSLSPPCRHRSRASVPTRRRGRRIATAEHGAAPAFGRTLGCRTSCASCSKVTPLSGSDQRWR